MAALQFRARLLGILGALALAPAAFGQLSMYKSTSPPGRAPLSDTSTWTLTSGQQALAGFSSVWIGCKNQQNDNKHKFFMVSLTGADADKINIRSADTFNRNGDTLQPFHNSVPTVDRSKPGGPRVLGLCFTPQPEWEVVELYNDSSQPATFTVTCFSQCLDTIDWSDVTVCMNLLEFGAQDAMCCEVAIPEIEVFPHSGVAAQDLPSAAILAPAESGVWTQSLVYVDPDGDARPEGGVRFSTSGAGLHIGEEYSLCLKVTDRRFDMFDYYAYNAATGEWSQLYMYSGGSRGDVNCDGTVDFFDIDPFLMVLFTGQNDTCGGSIMAADVNQDGSVDFFDIDPFMAVLFGQ